MSVQRHRIRCPICSPGSHSDSCPEYFAENSIEGGSFIFRKFFSVTKSRYRLGCSAKVVQKNARLRTVSRSAIVTPRFQARFQEPSREAFGRHVGVTRGSASWLSQAHVSGLAVGHKRSLLFSLHYHPRRRRPGSLRRTRVVAEGGKEERYHSRRRLYQRRTPRRRFHQVIASGLQPGVYLARTAHSAQVASI